ncbi:unnamed protein product, partial [Rotaria magnacalcarata]
SATCDEVTNSDASFQRFCETDKVSNPKDFRTSSKITKATVDEMDEVYEYHPQSDLRAISIACPILLIADR